MVKYGKQELGRSVEALDAQGLSKSGLGPNGRSPLPYWVELAEDIQPNTLGTCYGLGWSGSAITTIGPTVRGFNTTTEVMASGTKALAHPTRILSSGVVYMLCPCGSAGGVVPAPSTCNQMDGNLMPGHLDLRFSMVPYLNGDNRTGWTDVLETLLNTTHRLIQNPETGQEIYNEGSVPPTFIGTGDCSRALVTYDEVPEWPNSAVPPQPFTGVKFELQCYATFDISIPPPNYRWYATVKIQFGTLTGDPFNGGTFQWADNYVNWADYRQQAELTSPYTIEKNDPVDAALLTAEAADPPFEPTDPENFDFAEPTSDNEITPGPLP